MKPCAVALLSLGLSSGLLAQQPPPAPPSCADCHDEAKVFATNPHARGAVTKGVVPNDVCTPCHGDGTDHALAGGDKSKISKPAGRAGSDDVCLLCHDAATDRISRKGGMHANSVTINCLTCHSVHHGDPRSPHLVAKPQLALCSTCHTQSAGFRNKPYAHRLGRGGMECSSCHEPHGRLSTSARSMAMLDPLRLTLRTSDLSASYALGGFTLGAAWRHDSADDPIMRTDFLDRDRFRLRAGWIAPDNSVRASIVAEESNPKNDRPLFAFDAKIRQVIADAEVAVTQEVRIHASASRFRANSSILYRRPETFAIDTSRQLEDGKSFEGGVLFGFTPVSVDTAFAHFANSGTNAFSIDRFRTRAMFPLVGKAGLTAEWDRDRYTEPLPSYGNFQADRYGVFLRWSR